MDHFLDGNCCEEYVRDFHDKAMSKIYLPFGVTATIPILCWIRARTIRTKVLGDGTVLFPLV